MKRPNTPYSLKQISEMYGLDSSVAEQEFTVAMELSERLRVLREELSELRAAIPIQNVAYNDAKYPFVKGDLIKLISGGFPQGFTDSAFFPNEHSLIVLDSSPVRDMFYVAIVSGDCTPLSGPFTLPMNLNYWQKVGNRSDLVEN